MKVAYDSCGHGAGMKNVHPGPSLEFQVQSEVSVLEELLLIIIIAIIILFTKVVREA